MDIDPAIRRIAEEFERFGVSLIEGTDGRAITVLFTGDNANEQKFRMVLGMLHGMCDVSNQFTPPSRIPGVASREITIRGHHTILNLTVAGDVNASSYVLQGTATRSEGQRPELSGGHRPELHKGY